MKNIIAAAIAAGLTATAGFAGGVDRSGQSIAPLFEPGNYIEFSFTSVNPGVSGTGALVTPGISSGDMANSQGYTGLAMKYSFGENFDAAFIYEEPFGADVTYPMGTGYFAAGSKAQLNTDSFSLMGRYKFGRGFSAYAGLRQQRLDANATIPFVAGYSATSEANVGHGFLVGAAWEKPEIAARVSLTYNSKIKHDLATTERSAFTPPSGLASTTTVETPESLNLDFQTGIAEGTLVFGGVRYVKWSEFLIRPAHYAALTTSLANPTGLSLVSFADDTVTYSLGVGRQLNENWAVALSATHEPSTGGLKSNLAPTDGRSAIGVGVTYRQDGFKLQAGIQHIWIGDATTSVGGIPGGTFVDNTAIGFGLKVGFTF